ncbi:MAG: helix-turn-helix transcriptional regulator [Halanaerobiales bacterium]|nr:helix-turn-helix transcriptional regulator [Halanaerobiales bacterium]
MCQNDLQTIKKRIALARKEAGHTQGEMAKLLGISQPAYSYYESGDKPLPVAKINKIAQILDQSISCFMEESYVSGEKEKVLENISNQFEKMNGYLERIVEILEKHYS